MLPQVQLLIRCIRSEDSFFFGSRSQVSTKIRLLFCNDVTDPIDKSRWIELGTKDFIRTVGLNGNAPVADEGHKLSMLRRLDLRAHVFSVRNAALAFNIDEHQIVMPSPE
mgnify:CR=1 FL=1